MEMIKLFNLLNKMYPLELQEEWDNSGFFNKYENFNVEKVLISLDININVVNEAISKKTKFIISHHPIFINESDLKLNHIKKLIKLIEENNITILSLHTNFDKAKKGMNYFLAKKLKLKSISQLFESPYLFYGDLNNSLNFLDALNYVKSKLELHHLIYDQFSYHSVNQKKVKRIAIVGGSASGELYTIKKKYKIDLFLTGEVKWHLYNLAYHKNISIVDIGHIAEKNFIDVIANEIKKIDNNIEIIKSDLTTYLKLI